MRAGNVNWFARYGVKPVRLSIDHTAGMRGFKQLVQVVYVFVCGYKFVLRSELNLTKSPES